MTTSSAPSSDDGVFKGQCFCGAISFTVTTDKPGSAYLCHCLDCQRLTGSAFAWNVWFRDSDLDVKIDQDKALAAWKTASTTTGDDDNNSNDDESVGPGAKKQQILSTFGNDVEGKIQFCGLCGVRLFLTCQASLEMMKGKVIVPVGVLEGGFENQKLRPNSEAWVKRKVCWLRDLDMGLEEMRG